MRESATSGRPLQPLLGPLTCMSFSPPQEGGAGLRNRPTASSSSLPHSERKLAAWGKPAGGNLSRARGSTAHGRVRVSSCSCRSRRTARGSSGCLALSAGQRRSLAPHSFVFSRRSQERLGKKKAKKRRAKTHGIVERRRTRKVKMRVHGSWSWVVVLAGTHVTARDRKTSCREEAS
jgi:hypothetical protein